MIEPQMEPVELETIAEFMAMDWCEESEDGHLEFGDEGVMTYRYTKEEIASFIAKHISVLALICAKLVENEATDHETKEQ